jgi:penicillin-binding protein 1A
VLKRIFKWLLISGLVVACLGFGTLAFLYYKIKPTLPDVEQVRQVQLEQPLRVYTQDGKLMASFGETRRNPVKIDAMPKQLRDAFIAVEDARFYSHPGVDWQGIVRAVFDLVRRGGEKGVGGSTITQQLARNIFLTPERTFERKLREIFLALKIEREISKDEILELYLNKIFLGHRAYGVAAAAEVYYGKSLDQLTLAECAMLAALPKAPSKLNPVVDPIGAVSRRNHVLARMLEVGVIDKAAHDAAIAEKDFAYVHSPPTELDAPYVAELVRLEAEKILGETALTGGYAVYTTIDSVGQQAADAAVVNALSAYDKRHGWRGAEAKLTIDLTNARAVDDALQPYWPIAGLMAAAVLEVKDDSALLRLSDGQDIQLKLENMQWARRYLDVNARGPQPKKVSQVLSPGDVVRVKRVGEGELELAQVPRVQGALVSLDSENGAIRALVGGLSFGLSKFNRATQAMRQPGSSFKPFVYSAALEHGFTTASIINDAPLVFEDGSLDKVWKPQNDNEKFNGPTRLREAMVTSRNLVSVRVLDAIGVKRARRHILKFGFPKESIEENLSMALGTSAAPPLQMARGYAVFANGGFLVEPHLIDRIVDHKGIERYRSRAPRACRECPERLELDVREQEARQAEAEQALLAEASEQTDTLGAAQSSPPTPAPNATTLEPTQGTEINGVVLAKRAIDSRNAYIITSMLLDVVKRGTGRAALALGRDDLGGKTGTTNEHRDAWFSGFNARVVTSAWVGFDDFTSLGEGEFGAKAALPAWMDFMKVALADSASAITAQPPGITTARINPRSGLLSAPGDGSAIMEVFRVEDLSKLGSSTASNTAGQGQDPYDVF